MEAADLGAFPRPSDAVAQRLGCGPADWLLPFTQEVFDSFRAIFYVTY